MELSWLITTTVNLRQITLSNKEFGCCCGCLIHSPDIQMIYLLRFVTWNSVVSYLFFS